jgi:hypothetical protein
MQPMPKANRCVWVKLSGCHTASICASRPHPLKLCSRSQKDQLGSGGHMADAEQDWVHIVFVSPVSLSLCDLLPALCATHHCYPLCHLPILCFADRELSRWLSPYFLLSQTTHLMLSTHRILCMPSSLRGRSPSALLGSLEY